MMWFFVGKPPSKLQKGKLSFFISIVFLGWISPSIPPTKKPPKRIIEFGSITVYTNRLPSISGSRFPCLLQPPTPFRNRSRQNVWFASEFGMRFFPFSGGKKRGFGRADTGIPSLKRSQQVCTWKWMLGIRSFPFGAKGLCSGIFRCKLAVSFREGNLLSGIFPNCWGGCHPKVYDPGCAWNVDDQIFAA